MPPPPTVTPDSVWHLALFTEPTSLPSSASRQNGGQPSTTRSASAWEVSLEDILGTPGELGAALPVLSEGIRFTGLIGGPSRGGTKGKPTKGKSTDKGVKGHGGGGGGKAGGGQTGEKQDRIRRVFDFPPRRPRRHHDSEFGQLGDDEAARASIGSSRRKLVFTEQTSFDLDKVRRSINPLHSAVIMTGHSISSCPSFAG